MTFTFPEFRRRESHIASATRGWVAVFIEADGDVDFAGERRALHHYDFMPNEKTRMKLR